MLHIFYKSVVESPICFAAIRASDSDTEQTNQEDWLCAGDYSGAPGDGQVGELKEQIGQSSS